jgi:ABC-type transport system involved in multi-copper enzyme maturation permease subunit
MSLLALLFAYDAVSGERQRGTLALILANQLPRSTLLLGKYLGAMAVLLPLLLLGTAISLMVMLASEYVQLTSADWLVMLLMLIVSAGYVSLVWLAGLVISALTRHAHTSLVVGLFLWVVAVLIAPQAASAAASALRPLPSQRAQAMAEQQISKQADQQIYSYASKHPRPLSVHEQRFNEDRGSLYSGDVPVLQTLYAAPREYVEWALAGTRHGVPILVEAASTIQEMRSQAVLRMVGQADLARWLRRLTPAAAYYDSVAVLCATEHGAYLRFWQAVAAQRHQLIEYARARNGLGYRFFTREEVLASPPYAELAALEEQGQIERLQQLLGTGEKETGSLDLSEMPQLASAQISLGERISNAIPDLVLLLVLNMVMILLAAMIFSRADVRVS